MMRLTLAALLVAGSAAAETDGAVPETARSLAYCGSQVATLAWFYQGVVDDGAPEAQPQLDALLAMQSILITQVERAGEETTELFKRMTKASVNDLVGEMQSTQEAAALALSHVNTNVRACAETYFEKIEEAETAGDGN